MKHLLCASVALWLIFSGGAFAKQESQYETAQVLPVGERPMFGDSNPALGEPENFWWFKGNSRVAVWATEDMLFGGVNFTSRDK